MNVNMIVLALPKGLGDPKDHEGLLKLLNGECDIKIVEGITDRITLTFNNSYHEDDIKKSLNQWIEIRAYNDSDYYSSYSDYYSCRAFIHTPALTYNGYGWTMVEFVVESYKIRDKLIITANCVMLQSQAITDAANKIIKERDYNEKERNNMGKFVKKRIEVEAFQPAVTPDSCYPEWFMSAIADDIVTCVSEGVYVIKTLEGNMATNYGDYIIRGINGELYPCKPDIFMKTYDIAEEQNMTFGQAIEAVKDGKKICRTGWNGKDMFVVYQKAYPDGIPCNKQTAEAWGLTEGDNFKCEPYLQIKTGNGSHAMWVPSINDVLAEDWMVYENTCNKTDTVNNQKSPMLTWAENEINLAKKKHTENNEGEFDEYADACYDSALKAYKSLIGDCHSGLSIGITKRILNNLISGKVLTPIDIKNCDWVFNMDCDDGSKVYDCARMSSLAKKVYPDGRIKIYDRNRFEFFVDKRTYTFYNGFMTEKMHEILPLGDIYCPGAPISVVTEDFLSDERNGDYDTRAILYYIDPESKNIHHEVNRYFAEDPNDDSFIEITKTEYEARRALANELKLKRARMVESSDAVYGKEE